jgi:hypothetical protein
VFSGGNEPRDEFGRSLVMIHYQHILGEPVAKPAYLLGPVSFFLALVWNNKLFVDYQPLTI